MKKELSVQRHPTGYYRTNLAAIDLGQNVLWRCQLLLLYALRYKQMPVTLSALLKYLSLHALYGDALSTYSMGTRSMKNRPVRVFTRLVWCTNTPNAAAKSALSSQAKHYV